MRYAIDASKIKKELGWEPSLQFEEGMSKTVDWYLENTEWLEHIIAVLTETITKINIRYERNYSSRRFWN